MNTILITGCCGFIGSHLCDFYLSKNYKVIGLDNLLTGSIENIKHHRNNPLFNFIEHDVCNEINISDKINFILHFASTASPDDYLKYPIKTLQIGSIGTENILKLGVKNNSTVLVASTSEIYGDPLKHPQSESYFGNVNPIGPRGVYDEAKRYLEALTMAYKNKKKLSIRIVRIFNTYGPNMDVNDGRVITNFVKQALKNEDITIYGNGMQTRSFCYIDDQVKGLVKLMNSNYIYPINIGNPDEYTINEIADIIIKKTYSKSKIINLNLPQDDPTNRRPDISKAKKILNWEPKVSFQEGINKMIKYMKESI